MFALSLKPFIYSARYFHIEESTKKDEKTLFHRRRQTIKTKNNIELTGGYKNTDLHYRFPAEENLQAA
ncbi:hypothetical protein [Phytobacter sp. V91]|uniref:hypothetical protein n=1 Tax=Phytobacter sp. V91 TaxID=3369425 RepID=UPI003F607C15